jgi:hypothetical protein
MTKWLIAPTIGNSDLFCQIVIRGRTHRWVRPTRILLGQAVTYENHNF